MKNTFTNRPLGFHLGYKKLVGAQFNPNNNKKHDRLQIILLNNQRVAVARQSNSLNSKKRQGRSSGSPEPGQWLKGNWVPYQSLRGIQLKFLTNCKRSGVG